MPLSRLACVCKMFLVDEESLSREECLMGAAQRHLVAATNSGSEFLWAARSFRRQPEPPRRPAHAAGTKSTSELSACLYAEFCWLRPVHGPEAYPARCALADSSARSLHACPVGRQAAAVPSCGGVPAREAESPRLVKSFLRPRAFVFQSALQTRQAVFVCFN